MTRTRDHYQILGVIPDADPAVIKAAYRALATIYHPDRSTIENAEARMAEINTAFEVLSDQTKRQEYDNLQSSSEETVFTKSESENPFASNPIDKDWELATRFYPEMIALTEDLEQISWRLAFVFKLAVLENKQFSEAREIAKQFKLEYLTKYFGRNPKVIGLAERLLKHHEFEAARYLNEVVNVMGSKLEAYMIRKDINKRFEGIEKRMEVRDVYRKFKDQPRHQKHLMARDLVNMNRGRERRKFFGKNILLELNGENHTFQSEDEYFNFLLERFKEYD